MQIINYVQEVRHELTKVTWPTKEQTWKMTVTVFGISLFVGLYVGGLDYLFTNLLGLILK